MKKITGFFGFSSKLDTRTQYAYFLNCFGIVIAILYGLTFFIFLSDYLFVFISIFLCIILCTLNFFLLKTGKYFTAKLILIIAFLVQIIPATFLFFPKETWTFLFFLFIPIMTFVLFDLDYNRDRITIAMFGSLSLFLIILSSIYPYHNMIPYNHNLAVFYRVLTSVIVTGSFIAASAINTFYISKNLDALKTLGEHDNLTKQYNRRMLFEKGNSLYYISNRYHFNFSLVLIDIDFFKQINDTYGHLTGDKVLVELTGLLRENIRESDILFRYGGEEFVIILQHVTDTDTVLKIGEALRSAIENHNFSTTSGEVFKVTASFGIVAFAENQFVNFDEMMLAGDRALYTAKKNGRNQIVLSV